MNDKTNFYVFEKKEILLIAILVLLVAVTSFLFGLKIGSTYSFDTAGISQQTKELLDTASKKVELTSTEEEKVANIVNEQDQKADKKDVNKEIESSLKQKMLEEFSSENKKFNQVTAPAQNNMRESEKKSIEIQEPTPQKIEEMSDTTTSSEMGKVQDSYSGKYTIQLASYRSISEAKEFAEGFKVLGYNLIVNEVELPGKGTYFRVSLGVFESISKAKDFVLKNKSVFAERDYVFFQFE
jgi:septal ring-binding cell division protein DamX